jgi:hypothetical protein
MKINARTIILLFLFVVIAAACAPSQQEFVVVDQRELLGQVFREQTGNIDNSTGTVLLSQDIALRREFRHSIDLRINEGARVDRANVEKRILETYDLPDQVGEKNCIILADVPAGAIHQYDIEWTQVLREGNVEEGSVPGQGSILGTYRIVADLQCQTVGVVVVR